MESREAPAFLLAQWEYLLSFIRINVDALQGKGEGLRRGRGLDFVEMTMRCVKSYMIFYNSPYRREMQFEQDGL